MSDDYEGGSRAGTFGDLLRTLRERAWLSQAQLAESSGLSIRTIGNFESRRVLRPQRNSVRLLANALQLTGQEREVFFKAASTVTPDALSESSKLGQLLTRVSVEDLANQFLGEYVENLPTFRNLTKELVDELRLNIKETIILAIQYLEADDEASAADYESDIAIILWLPRRAAESGMPLDDLLRTYSIGAQIGLEAISRAANADEGHLVLEAARRLLRISEYVSAAVTRMYIARRPGLLEADEKSALALLEKILDSSFVEGDLIELSNEVKFYAAPSMLPFWTEAPAATPGSMLQLARALRQGAVLAVTDGAMVKGVANSLEDLAELANHLGILIAVGPKSNRVPISRGLRYAKALLRSAVADGRTQGLAFLEDHYVDVIRSESSEVFEIIRPRVIDPLAAHPTLVQTLTVHFECLFAGTSAAKRLNITEEQLQSQLARVAALTGRSHKSPDGSLELLVAVRYLEAEGRRSGRSAWR
jgi:transcriptional regulator with XRE-family HTH domain